MSTNLVERLPAHNNILCHLSGHDHPPTEEAATLIETQEGLLREALTAFKAMAGTPTYTHGSETSPQAMCNSLISLAAAMVAKLGEQANGK